MFSFDDHWSFLPQSAGLLSLSLCLPVPSAVDVITIINLARDYAYICFSLSLFPSRWWFFWHAKIISFRVYFGFLLPFSFFPSSRRLRQRRRQIKCLCRLPLIKTYHKFRYEKLFCTISNVAIPTRFPPERDWLTTTCSMSCCVRVFVCSSGCVVCAQFVQIPC